jgi:hypothetical protein
MEEVSSTRWLWFGKVSGEAKVWQFTVVVRMMMMIGEAMLWAERRIRADVVVMGRATGCFAGLVIWLAVLWP